MNYKQNKIMRKINLIILVLFISSKSIAQLGVNTKSPAHPLDIKTNEGNVIIDKTGKIGVGLTNPKVALDLRSGDNGAMALGMTNQTATEAGSGAIRYNHSPAIGVKGYVEFSDGEQWIGYFPYGQPRIIVIAEKKDNKVEVFENGHVTIGSYTDGIPARSATYLTSWNEVLDSDSGSNRNNFDPLKGEFVAPREGVYLATFTFALEENEVHANDATQVEAIWEVRDSSNAIIQRIKTNNGYASDTGMDWWGQPKGIVTVGSTCTASFYLKKGDKVRPFVWTNVSRTTTGTNDAKYNASKRRLLNTGGYNVLTIVEQ